MGKTVRDIKAPSRNDCETEILHGGQPVVLRGLVLGWPGVGQSVSELFQTLKSYDSGAGLGDAVFRQNGDPMGHVSDATRGMLGGVPEGREHGAIMEILSVLGPMVGLNPPPRK